MRWNSIGIKYENNEKKKVTDCSQRHRTKRIGLKDPQRVVEKNFSGPTYDISMSHLDPMIFNYQHIRKNFRMK